jgi:hypothetical protein
MRIWCTCEVNSQYFCMKEIHRCYIGRLKRQWNWPIPPAQLLQSSGVWCSRNCPWNVVILCFQCLDCMLVSLVDCSNKLLASCWRAALHTGAASNYLLLLTCSFILSKCADTVNNKNQRCMIFKESNIKRVKAWDFSVFYIMVLEMWRNKERLEMKN